MMPDKKDHPPESILFGAKRFLQGLPTVAASLAGLSGFAYIVGWAYARSYFKQFGASWILADIPALTILGYSWWPVLILLFFAYLGVTDLIEVQSKTDIQESLRFRISGAVLNYGRWVFITLAIIDVVLGVYGFTRFAYFLSTASLFVVVAMATSAFEILVFRLSRPDITINLPLVVLSYAIIVLGLFLAPTQMGRNSAMDDRNPSVSSLPIVTLRSNPEAEYLLLFSSGGRFYVFPAEDDAKYPPIQIASGEEIESIQHRKRREPKATN